MCSFARTVSQEIYHLSNRRPPIALTTTTFAKLLHSWLTHPSLTKLQKIVPSLSNLYSLECESGQLKEQTRTPFSKRVNNRTTSMFKVVHSDICCPSCVLTLEFHYYNTFIDDILITHAYFKWNFIVDCSLSFKRFILKFKISLVF